MSEQQRLQQEIEALQQSLTELDEKIAPIRARRAVERIDEQLRLDEIIRADEAERDRVENQLRTSEAKLESLNTSAQKAELVTEARRRERNQAYAEAIHTWETIRALTPDDLYIEPEIQRLQALQGHKASFTELIKDVSGRMLDIRPVFAQVVKRLRQMSEPGGEDPAIQTLVENFWLSGSLRGKYLQLKQ